MEQKQNYLKPKTPFERCDFNTMSKKRLKKFTYFIVISFLILMFGCVDYGTIYASSDKTNSTVNGPTEGIEDLITDLNNDYLSSRYPSVYAVGLGTLQNACWDVQSNESGSWGNYVLLRHLVDKGQVWYSLYTHLDNHSLSSSIINGKRGEAGARVVKGFKIGEIGSTGQVTGSHLHFGVRNSSPLPDEYHSSSEAVDIDGIIFPDNGGIVNNSYGRPLIPFFSRTNQSPGLTGYDVYGISNQPLYASIRVIPGESTTFRDIGVKGKNENGDTADVFVRDELTLNSESLPLIGSNTFTTDNPNGSDYVFYAFIDQRLDCQNCTPLGMGYPLKVSILPDANSEIIDNDAMNSIDCSKTGSIDPKPGSFMYSSGSQDLDFHGYYITSRLLKGGTNGWGRWFPSKPGVYRVFVHIPSRIAAAASNVTYKIYSRYGDAAVLTSPVDHSLQNDTIGEWRPLVNNDGSAEWEFIDSGYVELSADNIDANSYVSVDAVKFIYVGPTTVDRQISLGDALDNTALSWNIGGNASWFGQTSTSYYGGDAARSGTISHSQTTWIQTTVVGPGTLSFYWKVSSEANYDFLRFYIDGVEQNGRISGEINWQQKTFIIPSGSHTLRWAYTKDGSINRGSDAGWLDKVEFFGASGLGEAVDNTSLSLSTGGDSNWFSQTVTSYYGGDAAQSGTISHNQTTWIQTTVVGPGTISFYWKVSSEAYYDFLRFYIDGAEQSGSISGEVGWQQRTFTLLAGSHTLRWAYTKDGSVNRGSDAGWLDKVEYSGAIGLAEAVDNTSLSLNTGGDSNWFGQTGTSNYGGDAAQSGKISDYQSSWIQTTVVGPGILTFYWKVSSESGYDFLRFYIDGTEQSGSISGEINWQQKTFTIPYGSHTLRWTYSKDGSVSTGSDAGWLDKLEFIPTYTLSITKSGTGSGTVTSSPSGINCGSTCSASFTSGTTVTLTATPAAGSFFAGWTGGCSGTEQCVVTMNESKTVGAIFNLPGIQLGEAVDNTSLPWSTGGNANWFEQTRTYYYGNDALQSGSISHNQFTWIQTTVTGPGILSFYWTVSSEVNSDYLRFYIDGVEQGGSISGEVGWQQKIFTIPSGVHTLRWAYTKNGSTNIGLDAGWLDKVEFLGTTGLADALDNTTLSWNLGGNANWFGQIGTFYYNGDAAQSGRISDNQSSWIETTVTGPGNLSFYWKVSSEAGDYLSFYVDRSMQDGSISGEVDWRHKTYIIQPGIHTIRWVYSKNSSGSSGSDAGWLDKVEFVTTTSYTLNVSINGEGNVRSRPSGIDCSYRDFNCTALFAAGTEVTLYASPALEWTFSGWTGECRELYRACTIIMNANKSIYASFRPIGGPFIPREN